MLNKTLPSIPWTSPTAPRAADLAERVRTFVDTEVLPAEEVITADILAWRPRRGPWTVHPLIEELKTKARSGGLESLLPAGHEGAYAAKYGTDGAAGLTNLDYAPVAEATGRSYLAPLVFNCNAPDTGNMEVLLKYGSQGRRISGSTPCWTVASAVSS